MPLRSWPAPALMRTTLRSISTAPWVSAVVWSTASPKLRWAFSMGLPSAMTGTTCAVEAGMMASLTWAVQVISMEFDPTGSNRSSDQDSTVLPRPSPAWIAVGASRSEKRSSRTVVNVPAKGMVTSTVSDWRRPWPSRYSISVGAEVVLVTV